MEPESSLPYSQTPATCPYPEPTPSSPWWRKTLINDAMDTQLYLSTLTVARRKDHSIWTVRSFQRSSYRKKVLPKKMSATSNFSWIISLSTELRPIPTSASTKGMDYTRKRKVQQIWHTPLRTRHTYVRTYIHTYVVGSKSFRPDIQKPRQM